MRKGKIHVIAGGGRARATAADVMYRFSLVAGVTQEMCFGRHGIGHKRCCQLLLVRRAGALHVRMAGNQTGILPRTAAAT
jgi:hypothetical protein